MTHNASGGFRVQETCIVHGVGFCHVIEDVLSVLAQQDIGLTRRRYVLEDLANLLANANRGAELARRKQLFVTPTERAALDAFSQIDRCLGNDPDWKEKLHGTQRVLALLRRNAEVEVSQKARAAAAAQLKDLLAAVKSLQVGF
jgi:hypothetical protein